MRDLFVEFPHSPDADAERVIAVLLASGGSLGDSLGSLLGLGNPDDSLVVDVLPDHDEQRPKITIGARTHFSLLLIARTIAAGSGLAPRKVQAMRRIMPLTIRPRRRSFRPR